MESVFTQKLMHWDAVENDRFMPWKGEKDPYRIWLSEIILQQTRVEQGWRYYENFIQTFPNVASLANADESQVFKLWEGLGYYSRCRNLIAAAKTIHTVYKGVFPDTFSEILALKGVGPYTAAAISAFAFNKPHAVVDGNVQRVIARYFGITTPVNTGGGKKIYQQLADALLDQNRPAVYNQAIMDFGATICKPQQPLCSVCVQREDCEAFKHGWVNQLPVKEKAAEKKERWFTYLVIENEVEILIRQRTEKDIWQQLHEFVLFETESEADDQRIGFFLSHISNGIVYSLESEHSFRQVLSHQIIAGRFIRIMVKGALPEIEGYKPVSKQDLKHIAFPKVIASYFLRQQAAE